MIAATKGFIKWAGLILAVSVPMVSTQAHAVSVTVAGTAYELNSFTGVYNANTTILQSQTWWGNQSLALEFANAFAATGSFPLGLSIFAYSEYLPPADPYFGSPTLEVGAAYISASRNGFSTGTGGIGSDSNVNFVTATSSASSVPEINAGSLSQALLILFALWLVTWRRPASRVA